MASKGHRIELATYLKWDASLTNNFTIKEEYDPRSQRSYVTFIYCKICAKNADAIKKHPSCKGKAKADMLNYVVGTDYISKYNLQRHVGGVAHGIAAKHAEGSLFVSSSSTSSDEIKTKASESESKKPHSQPSSLQSLKNSSEEAYLKLFNTAYLIATNGKPFLDFEYVVEIQKQNGVSLIKDKQNSRVCSEMINILSDVIQEKIAQIVTTSRAFSILTDGSQPSKTGSELELVYVRVMRNGEPKYYCIALQELSAFGGADAASLKAAIDDVFENQADIGEDYFDKLICMTADGASVNTGQFTGLFTRMKDKRSSLITIHCVAHRGELVAKDAFSKSHHLKAVDDFYQANFKLLKRSGKIKSQLKACCEALGVTYYPFPKIHGTRFQHHRRCGFKRLIDRWIPMKTTYETIISAGNATYDVAAKIKGFLKKLGDYVFLTAVCVYSDILESLSTLCLQFEKKNAVVFNIESDLEKTKAYLTELLGDTPEIDELNKEHSLKVSLEENSNNSGFLEAKSLKAGHKRRKLGNREYVTIQTKVSNVSKARDAAISIKQAVIPVLLSSYTKRFDSFSKDIFTAFKIFDPQNWDTTDKTYGLDCISVLETQFATLLSQCKYGSTKVKKEWSNFKIEIGTKYPKLPDNASEVIWLYTFRSKETVFPNLCILAEIALSISTSNSTVERGFSYLTHTLSDRRLSFGYHNLKSYILVRNNQSAWSASEKSDILKQSVKRYLLKRKYARTTDASDFNSIPTASKKIKTDETSSSSCSESDEDSDTTDCHSVMMFNENDSDDELLTTPYISDVRGSQ